MDAFTSSQDGHGGSRPSLKYKKLIHFLKGESHTSLRHTKNVCQLLLQPPEPDPRTGHHKQLVFKGHHCQPTSTSHVLPASFLVRSTLLAEDFLLQVNSIPNAFQRASHWTTDNPEMNASVNRRFLSRSQKRVCESATFELAFSHSGRQVDAPFLPHARFLCSSICFPASASSSRTCLAFRLGSCSSVCDGKLLLLLDLTRTFSSRGETIDLSPVRGEEVAASRPMVWRKS